MKKIFIFLALILISGCASGQTNPDQMFNDFYQGSPPSNTFSIEGDNAEDKKTTNIGISNNKEIFTVSDESDKYSCTVVCEEK